MRSHARLTYNEVAAHVMASTDEELQRSRQGGGGGLFFMPQAARSMHDLLTKALRFARVTKRGPLNF